MAEGRAIPRGFTTIVDGGPGLAFLAALLVSRDFRLATEVLMVAAGLALAASFLVERRFRPLPTTVAVMAIGFGGASLLLHDPQILKMKTSIIDGILGALLIGGVALGRNPLRALLHASFTLSEKAWNTLAVRYGLFWWACALANEFVRRTQSDHTWALFRLATYGAGIAFALAQTPFLLRHGVSRDQAEAPPPDTPV
jgi:intracellular septation protein